MKIQICMKDTTAVKEALYQAFGHEKNGEALRAALLDPLGDSPQRATVDEFWDLCKQWVKWGELLSIEIDSDARTCRVMLATE